MPKTKAILITTNEHAVLDAVRCHVVQQRTMPTVWDVCRVCDLTFNNARLILDTLDVKGTLTMDGNRVGALRQVKTRLLDAPRVMPVRWRERCDTRGWWRVHDTVANTFWHSDNHDGYFASEQVASNTAYRLNREAME